jgi:hypothetical protein
MYTVTGNYTVGGTGILNPGNSTTTFDGTTVIRTTGTGTIGFNNITINAGKVLSVYSDFSIAGATLTWNGTFSANATTVFSRVGITTLRGTGAVSFGPVNIAAGTTFTPDAPYSISGNMTVNGVLRAGNSTTTFGGTTAVVGSATTSIAFNNIVIAVADSLIAPPGTMTVNGNFINNGFFNANGGTIAFSGNTTKSISGTTVTKFNSLIINNGTALLDVSIDSDQVLGGILTLTGSAHLDADGVNDDATFTLLSSGDEPTADASIAALPSGAMVLGNVTVQRFLSIVGPAGRVYRYVTPSVANASVSDFQHEIPVTGSFNGSSLCTGCSTDPSMFWYDETTPGDVNAGYRNFPASASSEVLTPGRGYAVFIRGNIDPIARTGSARFDLRGTLNAGAFNYNVSYTSSGIAANDGWNLIGNPYPSTVDWNAKGWSRTNLSASVYALDNSTYPGRYAVWNGSVGVNGGTRLIAGGQGFFVKATGPLPSLTSGESVKVAGTQTRFLRDEQVPNVIRIALIQGLSRDESIVQFRDSATTGFDPEFDAVKLKNLKNDGSMVPSFNLSTLSPRDSQKLAINVLPRNVCAMAIALDLADLSEGNYDLNFSEIESFSSAVALFVTDKYVQPRRTIDIRQHQSYSFTVTSDRRSQGSDRFVMLVSTTALPSLLATDHGSICTGQPAAVLMDSSWREISYSLWVRGAQIGASQNGTSGKLQFLIPADVLTAGFNAFTVLAVSSTCPTASYSQTDSLQVFPSAHVARTTSTVACGSGSVTLIAEGAPLGGYYRWYGPPDANAPLRDDTLNILVTPVLPGTKTYAVSVVNEWGCEGPRTSVKACVIPTDTAAITVVDPTTLRSNFVVGNHWYRDGEPLPDTTDLLNISSSGRYRLSVTLAGCTSSAEKSVVVTGLRTFAEVNIFPNPATGTASIEIADEQHEIKSCRLQEAGGRTVEIIPMSQKNDRAAGTFDVSHYPAGVYFITFTRANTATTVKFVKR